MTPEIQSSLSNHDESRALAWTSWQQSEKARKIARTECEDACEAGDLEQINAIFQSGRLDQSDAQNIVLWTIGENMLEPTQCLLEQGVDANAVPTWRLGKCRSLSMFKLLAKFGHDFKTQQQNILL